MFIKKIRPLCVGFVTVLWCLGTQAVSIPNELGEPTAGGFPRESSSAYQIIYGSVKVGNEVQRVIVTKPAGDKPSPALLFVGGLGCYSMDFSGTGPKPDAYHRIIDFVARLGFVTMRVEKTGMGDSKGTPCQLQSFQRELAGFKAGMKALASYPFVQKDRLYIFGHSIGGVIAPFIAQEVSVKKIAVYGSLATKWFDYDISNHRRQFLLAGYQPNQVAGIMNRIALVSQEFYKYKKTPQEILTKYPDMNHYFQMQAHWTYMQELGDVDPVADISQARTAVVVFSGSSDFIGSQWSEFISMAAQINGFGTSSVKLVAVPNGDHFIRKASSQLSSFNGKEPNESPLPFQESFLEQIKTDFLEL
ncbi:MAG: hypothetical protein OM95_05045 [Bdellovibrio sp. ArHS]|uniref:alpha/beta hydrolase family protein n=1 Tax=Bdellovibrio sp. ArHS TaxID=1569284 RepID=UPI000583EE11|nr:alpha/beta hydrolase [Bdellovibrio sp. ArHS]KHD89185.1 MAG: hypothetical protein OM95_05045 [Bdellovibrio sp. ArHS]